MEDIKNLLQSLQNRILNEISNLNALNVDKISIADLLAQQINANKPFKIDTQGQEILVEDTYIPSIILIHFDKFKLIFKNRFLITLTPFSIPIGKYEKTFVYYDDDQYSEYYLNEFSNLQLVKALATYSELQKKINALKNLGYDIGNDSE